LVIIIIVSYAANHHIRLIYERSRDTEDWRNDDKNKNIFKENTYILICNSISQDYCFYHWSQTFVQY